MRTTTSLAVLLFLAGVAFAQTSWKIEQSLDVAPVWSGHPVGFSLLTAGEQQFAAFYDADRRMTVASRKLDSSEWQFAKLDTSVGWDSHNYVAMALDSAGHLHVSGNMHCVPLIYFRSEKAHDAASLKRVPAMVGRNEARCTYPRFVFGPEGELIFTYRDGRSGNGEQIWNAYDAASKTWRRLLDQPLFSGKGKCNAYFHGPVRDSKGVFHICWVWRNTPDCATNHDLSYARSKDLVHWETSDGRPLALPITLDNAEVVDPVPPGGGIINGNTVLGFDHQDRPVISYHKFDSAGKTQLYSARREAEGWKIHQTSQWDYRWEFGGGGTIQFEIGFSPIKCESDGSLSQSYHHAKHGSGAWKLDEATLQPTGPYTGGERLPREIGRVESKHPGMRTKTAADQGESGDASVRYLLRWETLPSNRDRPHPGDPPPPNMLRLLKLRKA